MSEKNKQLNKTFWHVFLLQKPVLKGFLCDQASVNSVDTKENILQS